MLIPFVLVVLTLLLYKFLKPHKDFWEAYNILHIPVDGILDNFRILLGKKTVASVDNLAYEKLGDGKLCGYTHMAHKIVLIKDMDLLKKVLIKDFDYFMDRRRFTADGGDAAKLEKILPALEGDEWKGVRSVISPTFTTGKIRRMMEAFNKVSKEWIDHFNEEFRNSSSDYVDINAEKEAGHYSCDVIAYAVLGMNAGTIHNPSSIFHKMTRKLFNMNILTMIKFTLVISFPKLMSFFGISLSIFDPEVVSYFQALLNQTMKERMEGRVKKNDFIQLLTEARKGNLKPIGSDELSEFEKEAEIQADKMDYLKDENVANAQAFNFFLAGFGTVTNLIGFTFYMLALHPEVQGKLRDELNSKLFQRGDDKEIDYDELNELVYLDMVINEVLRKYPGLDRIERICVKEYQDPENFTIPKGAMICVPVDAIHNDKQYYDYPDKFYPEHFSPENKARRSPYAFLPFGSGPRGCIGRRFALVESKAAIARIVHNFIIEPSPKTPIPAKVKTAPTFVQVPYDLELRFRRAK